LGRRDRIAVEEPGYPGARAAFEAHGARVVHVPVDGEGLRVAALRAAGPRVRAVYVTPSHQYPLGPLMSAARRLELLEWAAQRNAWILEDDYDSDYRYVHHPLGAVQGLDGAGRVIYIGTFSKVLFPALRIGFLVVPPALWDAVVAAREALDIFPPAVSQLALAAFLAEGHFARHVRRTRAIYLERRAPLLDGLHRECDGLLAVHNADAGLHVSTLLADPLDDVDVTARMRERGLVATPLSTCCAGDAPRHRLLLGFGGTDVRRLAESTRALGNVLRSASRAMHRERRRHERREHGGGRAR
jgi:GntR family transcriptional regulator/MocR family aminotransferase